MSTPEELVQRIQDAVAERDSNSVRELCAEIRDLALKGRAPFPEAHALNILSTLRRKRHFHSIRLVAEAFILGGQRHPHVYRHYAQALLDTGQLTAGRAVLDAMMHDPNLPKDARLEAEGLLGRAYKQAFVTVSGTDAAHDFLCRSITAYTKTYEADTQHNLWHGINAVALAIRAQRMGTECPGAPEPRSVAEDILRVVTAQSAASRTSFDHATAMEACVALDNDQALTWAHRFVQMAGTDAFEIGSALRQLREIWQLDTDSEPGRFLIPSAAGRTVEARQWRIGWGLRQS